MYETRDKEKNMIFERLMYSLNKALLVMIVIGGVFAFASSEMFFTSLKPVTNFEDLQETKAEEGMHIKGELKYALDCFAYEETWTENKDGSRTPAKTSHYYYAIPGPDDTFFAVEVSTDKQDAMEALADETVEYVQSGTEPTTKVTVEGRMSKMDEEMVGLFEEYLEEIGYTQTEISAMGDFYYVEKAAMKNVQIAFGVGVLLVVVGIVLIVIRFIKSKYMIAR